MYTTNIHVYNVVYLRCFHLNGEERVIPRKCFKTDKKLVILARGIHTMIVHSLLLTDSQEPKLFGFGFIIVPSFHGGNACWWCSIGFCF